MTVYYILIADIGTSSPQQVVCTTDKNPCCSNPNVAGDWVFPNSAAPQPTTFRRDRSVNGEINLYRISNDVISPIGRFCCRVSDAIGVQQTICVNIG